MPFMAVFAAATVPAAAVAVALTALPLAVFICHLLDEKGKHFLLVCLIVVLLACMLYFAHCCLTKMFGLLLPFCSSSVVDSLAAAALIAFARPVCPYGIFCLF